MTISMDKKYRTRDGRDVRLLCVDAGGAFPVIGLIGAQLSLWMPNGRALLYESTLDLIEVRPRIKRDVWVNVYSDPENDCIHPSRVEADDRHVAGRLACVKLTIDCEEGEGLTNG